MGWVVSTNGTVSPRGHVPHIMPQSSISKWINKVRKV